MGEAVEGEVRDHPLIRWLTTNGSRKSLAVSAALGIASGGLGGLGYGVPSLSPVLLLSLLVILFALFHLTAYSISSKMVFALAASLAFVVLLVVFHAFMPIPVVPIVFAGTVICSVLLLGLQFLATPPGIPSVLVVASTIGLAHVLLDVSPIATSISPVAQLWAYPTLIGSCSLFGAAGWLFLVVLFLGSVSLSLKPGPQAKRKVTVAVAVLSLAVLLLASIHTGKPEGSEITVAAVQGGRKSPDINVLYDLSVEASGQGAALVVWPELALNYSPLEDGPLRSRLGRLARKHGLICVIPFNDDERNQNRLAVFDKDGEILGTYAKIRIAWPVGEERLPGEGIEVFDTACGVMGTAICYDGYFPLLVGSIVAKGASFIVVPAMSTCPRGANKYAPMVSVSRAVETGVPVVWAESEASSMIVDSRGRIVSRAGEGPMCLLGKIRTGGSGSLYARTGSWITLMILIISLASGTGWKWNRGRNRGQVST
jgi:apolipoprotein N-acyltransferase